jgi:hypothetical protein
VTGGLKLFTGLVALACSGCALHINRDPPPPPNFAYAPDGAADPHFDYTARGIVELGAPVASTRTHDLLPLSFTSSGHNGHPQNLVEGLYFRSKGTGAKKLVVVMPIWGTSTYPPDKISHGYARRAGKETNVIWIYGTAPLFPWEELATAPSEADFVAMARDSADRYSAAVMDMRRLMDWAATRPEIDAARIGFVGFSMSALVTATLVGNDSRVKAAVLMMGAAKFADVFSTCGDKAGQVRHHVMRDFGWTIERYHDFFQDLFGPADPTHYPGHYDPDEILMIDAMFDDCMPESARAALWEVTGHPKRITMLYKHRSSFYSLTPLGLNFARRKIYDFLDKALAAGPPTDVPR